MYACQDHTSSKVISVVRHTFTIQDYTADGISDTLTHPTFNI